MQKILCAILAAGLMLFSLTACTESNDLGKKSTDETKADASVETKTDGSASHKVKKGDCSTVYAEVIAVNGSHLTVSIGDRLFSLSAQTEILIDWNEGDQVILYYTGDFDNDMQVHYIDKWTENSEVQPPEDADKSAKENKNESVVTGS